MRDAAGARRQYSLAVAPATQPGCATVLSCPLLAVTVIPKAEALESAVSSHRCLFRHTASRKGGSRPLLSLA